MGDEVNEAVYTIFCKERVCVKAKKLRDKVMSDLRNYITREQLGDDTIKLIDNCQKLQIKNKHRRAAIYEKKIAAHPEYPIIGWASGVHFQ